MHQQLPPSRRVSTRYGRKVTVPAGTSLTERFPVGDIDWPVVDGETSDLDWTVYLQPDPRTTSNDDWDSSFLASFLGTQQAPLTFEIEWGMGADIIRDNFVQIPRLGIALHYVFNTAKLFVRRTRETLAEQIVHCQLQRGRPLRYIQNIYTDPSALVAEDVAQIPPFAQRIDLTAFQSSAVRWQDFFGVPLGTAGLKAGIPPIAARVRNTAAGANTLVFPFEVWK